MARRTPAIKSSTTPIALPFEAGIDLNELLPKEVVHSLIQLPPKETLPQITYREFISLVSQKSFLEKLQASIRALIDFKLAFYSKLIESQRQLSKNTKAMVEALESKGVSKDEIERQCPGHATFTSTIALANTLVHDLCSRKSGLTLQTLSDSITQAFTDPKYGLASLKGRDDLKLWIATTINAFAKNYKIMGDVFKNISLMGPPGSGKTRMAGVISWVFYHFYIIENSTPNITTSADIIAGFVGQTGARVRGVFLESLGRLLFIDEAYQMGLNVYGEEGITELVNLLDKYSAISWCVVAGYESEMMTKFMPKNKGLHRRFPHQFVLEPYSAHELTNIFISGLVELLPNDTKVTENDHNLFFSVFQNALIKDPDLFEYQAGDVGELSQRVAMKVGDEWENLTLGQKITSLDESLDSLAEKKKHREEY